MIGFAAHIGGAQNHYRADLLLDREVPALRHAQLEVARGARLPVMDESSDEKLRPGHCARASGEGAKSEGEAKGALKDARITVRAADHAKST